MSIPEGPHAVYRHYTNRGQLLYIGRSCDPDDRWRRLQIEWPEWTCFSARREDTWYPARDEAKKFELAAIHAEAPLFNIVSSRRVVVGYVARVELGDDDFLDLVFNGWGWRSPEQAGVEIAETLAMRADLKLKTPHWRWARLWGAAVSGDEAIELIRNQEGYRK